MRMSKNPKKCLLIGILLISFLTPYFVVNVNGSKGSDIQLPQSQSYSKENYTPILEEKSQGLGNITATNVAFHEGGFFNDSDL